MEILAKKNSARGERLNEVDSGIEKAEVHKRKKASLNHA